MSYRGAFLAAIALLAVVPFLTGGYEVSVLMFALIYLILAVGLNLVSGYCGQFSFAQGAFFGIGAYTTAIMGRDLGTGFWINLPAAIVVTGLFGLALGIPALRLKGHFLAIVTIAFQTVVYLTLVQWSSFTGGQGGLAVQSIGAVAPFGVRLFAIDSVQSYFWLTLAVASLAVFVAWRLVHSRLGSEWTAIRDDETLAGAVGINTTGGKLSAFIASAAFAGAAGVVTAHAMRGVTPDDFTIWISSTIVAMMIVGGKGSFVGPIIGALLLSVIPEFFSGMARYKMLFFGLILVASIIFMPNGIAGLARQLREKRA